MLCDHVAFCSWQGVECSAGLFKGNLLTVAKNLPFTAIQFAAYDQTKDIFLAIRPHKDELSQVHYHTVMYIIQRCDSLIQVKGVFICLRHMLSILELDGNPGVTLMCYLLSPTSHICSCASMDTGL